MAITTNRLIELAITGDPTAALIGATWSFSGGDLLTEVDAAMDAGVTGTTGIMQPGDLIDLDGNGTYEGTYQGRFNYTGSTFHLGDGSTVSGTINIIEVTVGGTSQYYMMVNDSLAADLDGKNLSSVTFGSSFATSPNTDGFNFDDATSYELVCFARGTMIATDRGGASGRGSGRARRQRGGRPAGRGGGGRHHPPGRALYPARDRGGRGHRRCAVDVAAELHALLADLAPRRAPSRGRIRPPPPPGNCSRRPV